MRRAARTDDNQAEIVKALVRCGCTVQSLAAVGTGVPDLLVGLGGVNYLMEVKDGERVPSQQRLNHRQQDWHRDWCGQVTVVRSVEEALRKVGLI